jgi:hypothetical protein
MEKLKQIGPLLSQHYEKIVLIVMLLLLAGAVFVLWGETQTEQEENRTKVREFRTGKGAAFKPVDLSANAAVLARARSSSSFIFAEPHHLFGPLSWHRRPDGSGVFKNRTGTSVGYGALELVKVRPLNFSITVAAVPTKPLGEAAYIHVVDEVPLTPNRKQFYVSTNEVGRTNSSNKFFVLSAIQGSMEDPEFVLQLFGSGQRITVSKDKPHVRPDAFEADLFYPPANKPFPKLRVGSSFVLESEEFKVVAVTEDAVTIASRLDSGQQHTIRKKTKP